MVRRAASALLSVFVAWAVLDGVLHGLLLRPVYKEAPNLWRAPEEMSMPLMYGVNLVHAACFVAIYWFLAGTKSLRSGLVYGLLFGIAVGVPMGIGSYGTMPIPLTLAWGWCLGELVESVAGGAIVGAILKAPKS
jgi:hypothetical protein